MNIPEADWTVEQFLKFFGLPNETEVIYSSSVFFSLENSGHPILFIAENEFRKYIAVVQNNKVHNDNDFPASVYISKKIGHVAIKYFDNAYAHRNAGPAVIEFIKTEKGYIKTVEEYYIKHKLHNPIGPAYRFLSTNGVWQNHYYINDCRLNSNMFLDRLTIK